MIIESREDVIRRLVIFALLLGADEGVLDKSPSYIWEKYEAACKCQFPDTLLIDDSKIAMLDRYFKKWSN